MRDPLTTRLRENLSSKSSEAQIPVELARGGLPKFMTVLINAGVPDPMAVGDAYSDQGSLQIGQFEATAELVDQWLTYSFLEGVVVDRTPSRMSSRCTSSRLTPRRTPG